MEIMPVSDDQYEGEGAPNWTVARRARRFNLQSILVLTGHQIDRRLPGLGYLYIDDLENMNGLDLYEYHRGIGMSFSASSE